MVAVVAILIISCSREDTGVSVTQHRNDIAMQHMNNRRVLLCSSNSSTLTISCHIHLMHWLAMQQEL
jgi:hypothetical protein